MEVSATEIQAFIFSLFQSLIFIEAITKNPASESYVEDTGGSTHLQQWHLVQEIV